MGVRIECARAFKEATHPEIAEGRADSSSWRSKQAADAAAKPQALCVSWISPKPETFHRVRVGTALEADVPLLLPPLQNLQRWTGGEQPSLVDMLGQLTRDHRDEPDPDKPPRA